MSAIQLILMLKQISDLFFFNVKKTLYITNMFFNRNVFNHKIKI